MPCLLIILALSFPRLVMIFMWFTTRYIQNAFSGGILIPLLGFLFLPLTTVVYAWDYGHGISLTGSHLIWLLLAAFIDLGGIGGGARGRLGNR